MTKVFRAGRQYFADQDTFTIRTDPTRIKNELPDECPNVERSTNQSTSALWKLKALPAFRLTEGDVYFAYYIRTARFVSFDPSDVSHHDCATKQGLFLSTTIA